MNDKRFVYYKITKSLPYLKKDKIFYTDYETGEIFGIEADGSVMNTPLRNGLSGYIWLLIAGGTYCKALEEK